MTQIRLLDALHAVIRRPDPPAVEEARAALVAFRASRIEAAPVSATCAVCRDVPDSSAVLSRSSNPGSLPAGCSRIIPPGLRGNSRCYEEIRCPGCGMGYVYERGYEWLMCESEDEETLTRLHVPVLLDRIAALLEFAARGVSIDLKGWLHRLESALRMA
ncbi:MAG: hypothetical protein AAB074_15540 [Planctomycetota bacterium]